MNYGTYLKKTEYLRGSRRGFKVRCKFNLDRIIHLVLPKFKKCIEYLGQRKKFVLQYIGEGDNPLSRETDSIAEYVVIIIVSGGYILHRHIIGHLIHSEFKYVDAIIRRRDETVCPQVQCTEILLCIP